MKFVFLLISLFLSFEVSAKGLSAYRYSQESYEDAKNRSTFELGLFAPGAVGSQPFYNGNLSAERQKKYLSELSIETVAEVSPETLNSLFGYLRDTPFLSANPFPRRATWLFPDDGCYARAAMMSLHYSEMTTAEPVKVFAFGDLRAKTANSPDGFVTWWYHVAIAYRVQDQVYVIDPSVEPTRPVTLQEWAQKISPVPRDVKFSFCSKAAYDPDSNCFGTDQDNPARIYYEQRFFLEPEWERLEELGRSPMLELGTQPPWKN